MHGIVLLYVLLVAMAGALVLGLGGAFDAMQGGEKWSWPKYGKTIIMSIVAGASAAGAACVDSMSGVTLSVALVFAFMWGLGIQGGTNTVFSLFKGTAPAEPPK